MAGVFERIKGPQKQLVGCCDAARQSDPGALELQEAKAILAEIFYISVSEVEEMIRNRFEAIRYEDTASKKDGLWPQEFWLEG